MNMPKENLGIAVTGDVDSGKSTLIGRFLYETGSLARGAIEEIRDVSRRLQGNFEFAYLLDSLEEERKGQLTIETTQVFCKNKIGGGFIFIDVPGHKELLKNMLCGVSFADAAILVVDVQKSIEQQTRRHAFLLKFLGTKAIIVALNKMDLAGFREIVFKKAKEEIDKFFAKIQLAPKYFIPISAIRGDNLIKKTEKMPWYKGLPLIKVLNTHVARKEDAAFRLTIQDIYNISKEKVAVGMILSGSVKKGEKVNILPLNRQYKVLAIKSFNKNLIEAFAPESIGLVLEHMDDLGRGQVVCKPELPRVSAEILINIFCVRSFNIKESLRFRCATQESSVVIKQVNGVWGTENLENKPKEDILRENDFAEIVIVTEYPVAIENFRGKNRLGRFVLQDNNKEICAVGIIP